jgi:hypothetical protein
MGYSLHQRLLRLKDWRLLQTLSRKVYGLRVFGIVMVEKHIEV